MMRVLAAAAMAATCLGGVTMAQAADTGFEDFPAVPEVVRFEESFRDAGFYAGARGGVGFAQDTQFTIAGPTLVENEYLEGFTGGAFFGFEVRDMYHGAGLRVEGELGYSFFDIDTHTVGGAAATAANSFGSTRAFTGMLNAYVDYGLGAFRPFIGGGVGVARLELENHGIAAAPGVMNDTQNGFAWQAMGGVAYDVTQAISLEAMVRYQSIMDVELASSTGIRSSVDLASTQVLLGVRFNF
jgi:OmpA-OmpF porin, OOP family